MYQEKKILIIGSVWPEPNSSAGTDAAINFSLKKKVFYNLH
jgi:hypothetical protein